MKPTIILSQFLCSCVFVMLTLAPATAEVFRLTASASHPPTNPYVGGIKDFVVPESLKRAEALGHTIEWTEAYAGALYDFQNTLEGIEQGLGDLGWVGTLWEPNKLPLHNVTYNTPFVSDDIELMAAIQGRLQSDIPAFNEAWTRHNQVYLGPQVIDEYVLLTKFPVNSVGDLDGKKIYAPGDAKKWLANTGAVGVDGGLPIYYNGLQTGVVDGAILPGSNIVPFKLHEVAPYVTITGIGATISGALTMNKDTFDGLPAELQDMFRQLGKEYGERVNERVAANRTKHFEEILPGAGATITKLPEEERTKWANMLPDIAGDWAKLHDEGGLPASEVLRTVMETARDSGAKPYRDWSASQ